MVNLESINAKCDCNSNFESFKKNNFKMKSGDDTSLYLLCPNCGKIFRLAIMLFMLPPQPGNDLGKKPNK